MLARITALSRRAGSHDEADNNLSVGEFQIDLGGHAISRGNEAVELTQKEFDLAVFLFRNTGRLLSRKHLMESVWGQRADLNTRTVDTHISRLRNKLSLTAENGWRLSSVYQHGYRLERTDSGWELGKAQVTG
jgi:DNA-binding response OmpR family regulator